MCILVRSKVIRSSMRLRLRLTGYADISCRADALTATSALSHIALKRRLHKFHKLHLGIMQRPHRFPTLLLLAYMVQLMHHLAMLLRSMATLSTLLCRLPTSKSQEASAGILWKANALMETSADFDMDHLQLRPTMLIVVPQERVVHRRDLVIHLLGYLDRRYADIFCLAGAIVVLSAAFLTLALLLFQAFNKERHRLYVAITYRADATVVKSVDFRMLKPRVIAISHIERS